MSIRILGYEVQCDECGDNSEATPQASLTRRAALELARRRGWKRFKHNGKMQDMCENCIDALKDLPEEYGTRQI